MLHFKNESGIFNGPQALQDNLHMVPVFFTSLTSELRAIFYTQGQQEHLEMKVNEKFLTK